MSDQTLSPILRRMFVEGEPQRAFEAFVRHISVWWPKAFSRSGENLFGATIESVSGGRVFETDKDGTEIAWGEVTVYEPSRRLVLTWQLGLPEGVATEVELLFLPAQSGTEIGFVRRGWSATSAGHRGKFDHAEGWDRIFQAYRDHARWYAARVAPETATAIVAMRRLWIATDDQLTPVDVRFYEPHIAEGSWGCRYEIDWPERRRVYTIFGVDSVQALRLAMSMVGSELYGSAYHQAGTLMFDGPGRGYGFPVSPSDREDLIGDDRELF